MLAALTVVAACAALLVGAAGKSNASIPSNFVQGSATLKLEGCSQDGTIALPNGSGEFVCPNDSDYTTGNLAKLWNELDLVPFRLTTTTHGGDPTDYNVIVAGDSQLNAATGWDVVGDPSINAGKSDAACTVSANAQDVGPGITGGADNSIYRVLRIHQDAGTTCVIDYYMRLALGAHLYSGSSLQAYVFSSSDFNGGKKTVPLPVGAIKPQAISKNMTATQNTNTPWNLTKSATPDTISYGNVCDSNFSNTSNVGITVTWTKLAAVPSGQVLLVTNIYAANPAARVIHTSVSDQMYAGTDQTNPLGSPATASADVPANTANYLLLTHTQTVAASSVTHYNDIATATYTDLVTGVPVPGNTTASAGADITSGSNTNSNATVTDSESISGSGLHFKVNSRTGSPTGSYTNGYTQGNYVDGTTTPAEVDWSSGSNAISGTGSITFNKTIKLDPAQATSGALSDTAILNGSDGFGPINAPLSVNLSSSKLGTLTITKTIPNVLQGSETATFHLHVYNSSNVDVVDPSVTFTAGQTSKDVAVSGLALGDYTVSEDTATGWQPQASQNVSLTGCNAGVEFDNQNAPAVAQVKKVTDPAGYEAGWVMTLNGPGTPAGGEAVTTTGTGFMPFTTALEEGSYTITETAQTGWTQTNASSECSFTVSYPADNGRTFSCTITNRSRAHVHVNKSFEGSPLTGSEAFTFQLRSGSSAGAAGTILESEIANVADSGVATFTTDLIPGQTYAICEVLQANINTDLTGYNPGGAAGVVCQDFTPTPGQSKEFNVNNTPVAAHAKAVKITVPSGHQSGWTMNLKSGGSVIESGVSIANGSVSFSTDLQDGVSYTIEETSQVGWDQTSATGDCSFTVHYPADANKTFTCTITNTERGSITIKKVTDPASGTGFTFTGDVAGTLDDQQTATTSNLVPGTYHSVEGALTGTAGRCSRSRATTDPVRRRAQATSRHRRQRSSSIRASMSPARSRTRAGATSGS